MRILEIGFQPLLKAAFPGQTEFIDTRFRWEEARTYQARRQGFFRRLGSLAGSFLRAARACARQEYDVVVTRCLGPVNSFGQRWPSHLARVLMGRLFRRLVLFAARGGRVKLAVIDLTDHVTIHPRDRELAWRCDLYFKRELADNHWHTLESVLPRGACAGAARLSPVGVQLRSRLRPFALGIDSGCLLAPVAGADKRYDLFYSGTSSELPVREGLPAALDALRARGWRVLAPRERLPPEEFRDAVRQSRLCLSPGGVGWDCYRHYEVAAYGSVPVLNYRPLCSIAPFRHGVSCFYYDPQDDLAARVHEWLGLPDAVLDEMVLSAQRHLKQHFTFEAIAAYVVAEIEKLPCRGR